MSEIGTTEPGESQSAVVTEEIAVAAETTEIDKPDRVTDESGMSDRHSNNAQSMKEGYSSTADTSLPTSSTCQARTAEASVKDEDMLPQESVSQVTSKTAEFEKKDEKKDGGVSDVSSTATANIPTRQYLDQTVVPILLQALGALAKERPQNPIEYLANYLLKEKDRFTIGQEDANH
ncbi:hypothetical protein AB6A40_000031 [Gnathostoma spinigerum]|uniref:Protein dpy-30 homolog n=1 Tax=Gnathostoma spinigerum TaxID=75299 RepID=A0ABD6E9G4_9BILA